MPDRTEEARRRLLGLDRTEEARRRLLGSAALVSEYALRALGETNDGAGGAKFAELDSAIRAGRASLGVYVQRTGDQVYISACAMPPWPQDPFTGNRLITQGPFVLSGEDLDALQIIDRGASH